MPEPATNPSEPLPVASAASVIEQPPKTDAEEKDGQKAGVVREAAHAAAEVEADATIAAKKVEEEAAKLAKEAGERVAQKWLTERFAEIEAKAEGRITALKTWLEERLAEIEGKKKAPEEKPPENSPVQKPSESPVHGAQNETVKKKRLRI